MQYLEGSGTPVLYIGHTVLKGYYSVGLGLLYTWCVVADDYEILVK
jgi:hypothetical protein